jgi:hypothetical protein
MLNGSQSQAISDVPTLYYLWQQIPNVSPASAQWTTSQALSQAAAILPQFGPYNFQLTITDSAGLSTSCSVHDGAAESDTNGVVVYPLGALYSAANQFLGPLIQWGKNPWPWYDTSHQVAADANIAALGPPAGNGIQQTVLNANLGAADMVLPVVSSAFNNGNYGGIAVVVGSEQILLGANIDGTHITIWQRGYRGSTPAIVAAGTGVNQFWYWDWWDWFEGPGSPGYSTPGSGCTVSGSSNQLVCAGAQFISGGMYSVCNSNGTPNGNSFVILWHPTDSGKTGRKSVSISSCTNDTTITMSDVWSPGVQVFPGGSGLHYSIGTNGQLYWDYSGGSSISLNYYDNVAGYYQMYMRSGIDTYLAAARQLADAFYTSPNCNQGYTEGVDSRAGGYPQRMQSNLGLWLRSLDSPPFNMTPGLERISQTAMWTMSVAQSAVGDAREDGYAISELAYTLALNTDPGLYDLSYYVHGFTSTTYQNAAKAVLAGLVSPSGSWNYYLTGQFPDGGWLTPDVNVYSGFSSGYQGGTSVSLVNGSTAVVGTNTTWNMSPGYPIWFWHGSTGFPANNAGGDSTFYYIAAVTDTTHITLNAPYTGATCSPCGYEVSTDDQHLGWGSNVYAMGIAARGMHYAANSLAAYGDATDAAYARMLAVNANSWLINVGRRSDTNGVNYGADFVNCAAPIAQSNELCSRAANVEESVGYSAEAADGWTSMYLYNQDSATKAVMDAMYNQMWAKPGTCPAGSTICNSTVTSSCYAGPCYLAQFDPTVDGSMLNGYGTGIPQPKWFGQFFGFGNYSSWPAARLGGVAPSTTRQIYIGFSLGSIANATQVVVTVTAPNGSLTSTTCISSPCQVTIPRVDQPGYSVRLQYQSAGGTVLASSIVPVIESQ